MKQTLAFAKNRNQFKCDIGNPAKRMYLGSDAATAQARKLQLVELWKRSGEPTWTPELLERAETIRKGETIRLPQKPREGDDAYHARLEQEAKRLPPTVPVQTTATIEDYHKATIFQLQQQVKDLTAIIYEKLGAGTLAGPKISLHEAIDEFMLRRIKAQPGVESVRTENNALKFARVHVPDCQLTALSWTELNDWFKAIAARPISKKFNTPIRKNSVKNCFKMMRQFIRWANKHYSWKRPEDWMEATLVRVRRTRTERREAAEQIDRFWTVEEIGVLWKYAIPSERMLILLGLNFGFTQAEITDLEKDDLFNGVLRRLRGKSEVAGRWMIWQETKALAATQFDGIPKRRQHIANKWNRLILRVRRDLPTFKNLSFKWLRKSGSSAIRRIANGETASLYISHGSATDDDLLEDYASKDWAKLDVALDKFRTELLPHFAIDSSKYVNTPKIERIKADWIAGKAIHRIMSDNHASRATVYRHKPQPIQKI